MKKLETYLPLALILTMVLSLIYPSQTLAEGLMPDLASSQLITLNLDGKFLDIPRDLGIAFLHRETGRIMVPIRFLSDQLEWSIDYLPPSHGQPPGFYLQDGSHQVKMYANTENALLISSAGVSSHSVDSPALIYNNRFYVPLRFISEVMGYKVQWLRYKTEDIVTILPQEFDQNFDTDMPTNIKDKPLDPDYETYSFNGLEIKGKFISQEEKFANLLTAYREIHHLTPAVIDKDLQDFSRDRALEIAYDLIKTGKANHTRPNEAVLSYGENLQYGPKSGYNLVGGYSEELALGAWIKSQSHDRNLRYKTEGDYLLGYSQFIFELKGRTFIVGVMNYTDSNIKENV